jgi:hypothetical protein
VGPRLGGHDQQAHARTEPGGIGARARLHGHDLQLPAVSGEAGDGRPDQDGCRPWRHVLRQTRARAAQRWRSRSRLANDASSGGRGWAVAGTFEPQIPTLWAKARTRGSTGTTAAPRRRVSQIDRTKRLQTDYALLWCSGHRTSGPVGPLGNGEPPRRGHLAAAAHLSSPRPRRARTA